MSGGQADAGKHQEIIIVRRGGDHEDGHHGGAWKIAFADFMTAMMCFFLVMWLINAANEQTKASVASYFNPVKLVDRNTSRKGLDDAGDGPSASGTDNQKSEKTESGAGAAGESDGGASREKSAAAEAAPTPKHSDDSLFADPYAVLAEIAQETGTQQNVSVKGDGGASDSGPATGASGGEAYRDPFAPDFWTQQMAEPSVAEASAERSAPAAKDAEAGDALAAQADAFEKAAEPPGSEAAPAPAPAAEAAATKPPGPVEKSAETPAAAEKTAAEIREEIAKSFGPKDAGAREVSVAATKEGVVISVTEGLDFGMFEVGSAVPQSVLVRAIDKIGAALKAREGTITIRGHTDARPFHNAKYDNWRLSTARAQSAYYMLLRAGVDEKRVVQVAGVADRDPKLPSDPLNAANRRIEILLEVKK